MGVWGPELSVYVKMHADLGVVTMEGFVSRHVDVVCLIQGCILWLCVVQCFVWFAVYWCLSWMRSVTIWLMHILELDE